MSKSHFFVKKREEILKLAAEAKIDSVVLHEPLFEKWDEKGVPVEIIVTQKDKKEQGDLNKLIDHFKEKLKKMVPFSVEVSRKDEMEVLVSGIVDDEISEISKSIIGSAIPLQDITEESLSEQFKKSMASYLEKTCRKNEKEETTVSLSTKLAGKTQKNKRKELARSDSPQVPLQETSKLADKSFTFNADVCLFPTSSKTKKHKVLSEKKPDFSLKDNEQLVGTKSNFTSLYRG